MNENEPINDNLYLAAASQAAVADKASGAYDEFLFNDDGIRAMPFELAVDSHTNLLTSRLEESLKSSIAKANSAVTRSKTNIANSELRVNLLNKELEDLDVSLDHESQILNGEIKGEHEVYWPASNPEFTSKPSAYFQLSIPWMIFAFVGLADLGIFIFSLGAVFPHGGREIFLFAMPAVGIQVGFPHLVGHRVAWLIRGSKRKYVDLLELIVLAGTWLVFCEALTKVRMNYVKGTSPSLRRNVMLLNFVEILTLLMIIGLGAILIFSSARRNPHQSLMMRLKLKKIRLREKLNIATANILQTKCDLELAEVNLAATKEAYSTVVESSSEVLAEAAKSIYRRALVNSMGLSSFTSSYLLAADLGTEAPSKFNSNLHGE